MSDVRYTTSNPCGIRAWEPKNLWPSRKRHGGCSFSVFTRQGGSPVVDMRSRRGLGGAGTAAALHCMARPGSVRTEHELRLPALGWGHGLTCGKWPRATSQARPWPSMSASARGYDKLPSHAMQATSPPGLRNGESATLASALRLFGLARRCGLRPPAAGCSKSRSEPEMALAG